VAPTFFRVTFASARRHGVDGRFGVCTQSVFLREHVAVREHVRWKLVMVRSRAVMQGFNTHIETWGPLWRWAARAVIKNRF